MGQENDRIAPQAIVTDEAQKIQSAKKEQRLLIIRLSVFLIIFLTVPLFFFLFKKLAVPDGSKTTSNSAQNNPAETSANGLFYIELDYNPQTKQAVLQNKGRITNTTTSLLPSKPPESEDVLSYRITVSPAGNKEKPILGWGYVYKKLGLTAQKTYQFTVITDYRPKASIRVYIPDDKLIWEGAIR